MIEQGWYEILADLQRNPVGERELQKVKNQVLADSYRRLQSNFFLLLQLGLYEAQGGWEYINESPAKLQAVTAADIQRVAKEYFAKEKRSVAIYTRKEGSAPVDPELAALSPLGQQTARQAMGQLMTVDDPARLADAKERMEAQKGSVPEEMRPAFEYIIRKIQERIDELEAAGQE